MNLTRKFSEFVSTLDSSISVKEMYASLSNWVTTHRSYFDERDAYSSSALQLSGLDILDYYINSDINPDLEIRQLKRLTPSSDKSLSMIIRDLLWSVICRRVEYLGNDGVVRDGQLLWSPASHAVVIEDADGVLLTGNLNPIVGKVTTPLSPASKPQIDAFLNDPKTASSIHLS